MRWLKRIISMILALSLIMGLIQGRTFRAEAASAHNSGEYEYILDDKANATITKYLGNKTEVEIPLMLDGHNVVAIGDYAFNNCTSLTQITIPEEVTSIGNYAFACTSLKSLELPSKINTIGYLILDGVEGVTKVTIPQSVKTMYNNGGEAGPFAGSGVKEAVFEEGIEKVPDNAFRKCTSLESH